MNQVNPVLAMLSNATQNSGTMARSNPMQMMAQFAEFKKTMQGKNPEAIVKQMLANGQMSQAQCCCTTQRAIDGVNYNQAINTASINANIDAKFAAMEKNQLEQTIAAQQAQISQLQLAQQMNNVVRYPNGFTYNAGMSPFCGGCCSGC